VLLVIFMHHLDVVSLVLLLLLNIYLIHLVLAAYALFLRLLLSHDFGDSFHHRLCLLDLASVLISEGKNSLCLLLYRMNAKCLVGFSNWWILLVWINHLVAKYRSFFSNSLCLNFNHYLFLKFNLRIIVVLAFLVRNNQLKSFCFIQ